ncbi:precorrin-2 dehydrogenase/sirohydrochlorin ferrochelatase family protein [Parasphingorhabdus sp.]|uniref:precorrin-2 dehydrogenase/sirohydrochlorin ferrochelatase family protein n=1 Tax=Parasphingorhabdus sp. TaxID=2709688 RepID=UPI002F936253
MNQFPIFVNLRGRKVILIGSGEMADAKRRLYERAGAIITDDEQAEAALAVVALEHDDEAEMAAKHLKKRDILVNVVDRPDLCDFTTPAIIDRHPVLIAIGTGGASAGLAKALRQRLERLLPDSLGSLAENLLAARGRIRRQWPDSAHRRRAIDAALDPGAMLDPFADRRDDAVDDWLANKPSGTADQVIEIDLASTDPDEMTIRQARLLGQSDRIFADSDVPEAILKRARADAQRIDLDAYQPDKQDGLTLLIRMK